MKGQRFLRGSGPEVRSVQADREGARNRWFAFLEEECGRQDGLLCYYDSRKSSQATYFCQVLARCLLEIPEAAAVGEDCFNTRPEEYRGALACQPEKPRS